jgi:glycine oxidase
MDHRFIVAERVESAFSSLLCLTIVLSMSSPFLDTIVIGGGIVGASAAWKLARAGQRVTLVDAGSVGGEASWAGAGMLAPGGEIVSHEPWLDLALESMRAYPDFVAQLQSESGVAIDYRVCGGIDVAFDDAEWQALSIRGEKQRALGIHSTVLDRQGLRRLIPLLDREFAGALCYPDDALIDPRDVMRALTIACRSAGVEIREAWRASAIHVTQHSVMVAGQTERLHALSAVLSAGAWSTGIAISGAALPPLPLAFPVKGMLTGYTLDPGVLNPILRYGHTYLLQRSTGFTLAGTTSEQVGFDRAVDTRSIDDITSRVGDLWPWLRQHTPDAAWVGFRPGADAPGPVIRRAGDSGLWLSYGHFRNGILLAPVTARLLTEGILASAHPAPVENP